MALNFPANPSDEDRYEGFVYDATAGVWNADTAQIAARFVTSGTAPSSPIQGDGWFDTNTAKSYIYYDGYWTQIGAYGTVGLDQIADININSPSDGQVLTYDTTTTSWINETPTSTLSGLSDTSISSPADDEVLTYDNGDWVNKVLPTGGGFTASTTITATNSSWPVPTLASPIVRVVVIGGSGGGGGAGVNGGYSGSAGGTTTFNAGTAGTVTAIGGAGGHGQNGSTSGGAGIDGPTVGSGGQNGTRGGGTTGHEGRGGQLKIAYLDLTGISTVNVTIGAGGTGGAGIPYGDGSGANPGGAGGRGEVIVEYVAG